MGQYYVSVNVEDMEQVNPHEYDNGGKLMEHSYVGNNFVEAVELLLLEGARWHKKPIVWAGDYADNEDNENDNLYFLSKNNSLKMLIEAIPPAYNYLVNYDKQEYVDKGKCPITDYSWGNLKVHPLPLLTAEGNGRGGGDYHKESGMDYIGSWARCRLGLLEKLPEGFTEITPNFKENE